MILVLREYLPHTQPNSAILQLAAFKPCCVNKRRLNNANTDRAINELWQSTCFLIWAFETLDNQSMQTLDRYLQNFYAASREDTWKKFGFADHKERHDLQTKDFDISALICSVTNISQNSLQPTICQMTKSWLFAKSFRQTFSQKWNSNRILIGVVASINITWAGSPSQTTLKYHSHRDY
ncbi:hypothetical protein [uncultured Roseobacter sp.]|uniref:hypothetical protein n=1 Tax=uncultured Roseobacter sp. TaxID=114847 RepID=UPI0026162C17|nr:hypothetical protein [uncultured Roseobacter sp.]